MPFRGVSAQAVEIAPYRATISGTNHFTVGFEESRKTVCTFAEWPRLPRLNENLTNEEVPHRPFEKCEDRIVLGPYQPLLGNNRACLAIALVHVPVFVPGNPSANLP